MSYHISSLIVKFLDEQISGVGELQTHSTPDIHCGVYMFKEQQEKYRGYTIMNSLLIVDFLHYLTHFPVTFISG